jgi:hypothetical protein
MPGRLLACLLLLGLCSCTSLQRPPSNVGSYAPNCVGRKLADMSPRLPCSSVGGFPPGTVITNPDGNGPQVILWGPPSYGGGGGAG